jgi:hypothetical protein
MTWRDALPAAARVPDPPWLAEWEAKHRSRWHERPGEKGLFPVPAAPKPPSDQVRFFIIIAKRGTVL